jgi:hypothetical protein
MHWRPEIDRQSLAEYLQYGYIAGDRITKIVLGPRLKKMLAAEHGHIVIRVYPPGDKFEVFVHDDSLTGLGILQRYGPYQS